MIKLKKGKYYLIEYSRTHNQILLRNYEGIKVNHDLLFEGVSFISVSMSFELLELIIEEGTKKSEPKFKVTLKCKEAEYYIHCFRVKYQQNDFHSSQSSIPSSLDQPATMNDILNIVKRIETVGYEKVKEELEQRYKWTIINENPIMID